MNDTDLDAAAAIMRQQLVDTGVSEAGVDALVALGRFHGKRIRALGDGVLDKTTDRRIAALEVDVRFGLPVPWFVPWYNGVWEFRMADARKVQKALREKLCWVCGEKINGAVGAFTVGPMCVVNHVSAEPPAHIGCAKFSTMFCPFLVNPNKRRRVGGINEEDFDTPGIAIKRNPGVIAIYTSRSFHPVQVDNGTLVDMGHPVKVTWWTEGRAATRDEVMESITSGCPALRNMAEEDGPEALAMYERMLAKALTLVPDE